MKKYLKVSTLVVLASLSLGLLSTATLAAPGDLLPEWILAIFGLLGNNGICTTEYIVSRAQFVLFMVLGGIVLVSVVYALMAAFKYIRSEGEPGKMEEAQKSIKAIFFGIAAMVIAIVGIVLVFVVVGVKQTNPTLLQTCIQASSSEGCYACQNVSINAGLCDTCEKAYAKACKDPASINATIDEVFANNFKSAEEKKCLPKQTK